MFLLETDLLKIAEKEELQGIQKYKTLLSNISALDVVLNDVYSICRPKPHDYTSRRDLIRIFNVIAKEIYGNHEECPVVEEFGSFLMDMFTAQSDLDLSINFTIDVAKIPRAETIKVLRKFAKKLRCLQKGGHVINIQSILGARVPVLKVTDCGTGIECDLSVGNIDGIAKSQIVLLTSAIDERFPRLCFLMKAWAKAHDINSSKEKTLNSLSLIALVAFHLQSRDPPILPPFSAILKDGRDPASVKNNVSIFLNYGERNKESLAELFVTLLIKLESVRTLWPEGLCASIYEGSWIRKTWKSKDKEKVGCMSVEDFIDRSGNIARAVHPSKMSKIDACINSSLQQIQTFKDGQIKGPELQKRLFGSDLVMQSKGLAIAYQSTTLDQYVNQNLVENSKSNTTPSSEKKGPKKRKKNKRNKTSKFSSYVCSETRRDIQWMNPGSYPSETRRDIQWTNPGSYPSETRRDTQWTNPVSYPSVANWGGYWRPMRSYTRRKVDSDIPAPVLSSPYTPAPPMVGSNNGYNLNQQFQPFESSLPVLSHMPESRGSWRPVQTYGWQLQGPRMQYYRNQDP